MDKTVGLSFWGTFFLQYQLLHYFSTYVFDQFTLVIFFIVLMISPLFMTLLLKIMTRSKKPRLAYFWGVWATLMIIGQIMGLFTENLVFYNVFLAFFIGTLPLLFVMFLSNSSIKLDSTAYYGLVTGALSGFFVNLFVGMVGLGLSDMSWNSVMIAAFGIFAIFFFLFLKKQELENHSSLNGESEPESQAKPPASASAFLSRFSKSGVALLTAFGWGLWQVLIQDIYSYPAMISAKTRVAEDPLFLPSSMIIGGLTIGYFIFGIFGYLGQQSSSNTSSRKWKSKHLLPFLSLLMWIGLIIYAYGEGLFVGVIILGIFPLFICEFLIVCRIYKALMLQPWQLMGLFFVANVLQFALYAYHYFMQQIPWIPILAGFIFTIIVIIEHNWGGKKI